MLSKPATMILGLINQKPRNAYEIIKTLEYMNVKWWFNIANSTVYATIKTLEKNELIRGKIEKNGKMPDKTIYTITSKGKTKFLDTLKTNILKFDYDTNIFTITAFFLDCIPLNERQELLENRLTMLNTYLTGIEKQSHNDLWQVAVGEVHVANVQRMTNIISAEISGTQALLNTCS